MSKLLENLPMDAEARLKAIAKRVCKQSSRHDVDELDMRASMGAFISCYQVNGKVAIGVSGRDCDGVPYGDEPYSIVPATVMHVVREMKSINEWLDGHCRAYLMKPSTWKEQ